MKSWTQKADCCPTCKHVIFSANANYWCKKHSTSTKPWRVCDDFESEKIEMSEKIEGSEG